MPKFPTQSTLNISEHTFSTLGSFRLVVFISHDDYLTLTACHVKFTSVSPLGFLLGQTGANSYWQATVSQYHTATDLWDPTAQIITHWPIRRLFSLLYSSFKSNVSPANINIGFVPSGHLLFCGIRILKQQKFRLYWGTDYCINGWLSIQHWMKNGDCNL